MGSLLIFLTIIAFIIFSAIGCITAAFGLYVFFKWIIREDWQTDISFNVDLLFILSIVLWGIGMFILFAIKFGK